jgi:hypothetical protein
MAGSWGALLQRVRAMHEIWSQATAELSAEQVNHHERAGVLPITFSLFHYVNGEDRNTSERLLGATPLWSDDWAARTGLPTTPIPRGTPLEVAEQLRITDYAAWLEYQQAVFARTEQALREQPAERWSEVVFDEVPPRFKGGFLDFLLDGRGPVMLGDLCDVLFYQHGMRHAGEIEHARSLVGLQGVG